MELAVKAALARVDPLLLMPQAQGGRWNSTAMRLLDGVVTADDRRSTVGTAESVERWRPESVDSRLRDWTGPIFGPRNAIVHLAMIHPLDHSSHSDAARAFFQALLRSGHCRRRSACTRRVALTQSTTSASSGRRGS